MAQAGRVRDGSPVTCRAWSVSLSRRSKGVTLAGERRLKPVSARLGYAAACRSIPLLAAVGQFEMNMADTSAPLATHCAKMVEESIPPLSRTKV